MIICVRKGRTEMKRPEDKYEEFIKEGTGSHSDVETFKIIEYPFNQYKIKIKLTPSDEFIGIIEVEINKEFLSHKQKIAIQDYHDVEDFYKE